MYHVKYTKAAVKDLEKIRQAGLSEKVKSLISIVKNDPFQNPPPYEKLIGDLRGLYSRRINVQHRFVYEVFPKENCIKILRLWNHYE